MIKNIVIILLSLAISITSFAGCKNPVRVAVIDTGFYWHGLGKGAKLCKFGHKDFSNEGVEIDVKDTQVPVPLDTYGHGTNVVGVIQDNAPKNANYCIVVIKFYSQSAINGDNALAWVRATEYAVNLNVDIINYSGGGPERYEGEYKLLKLFLNKGHTVVAAAGNHNKNLDDGMHKMYPAMYDPRIISVGALMSPKRIKMLNTLKSTNEKKIKENSKIDMSNYGKEIKRWEVGQDVEGYGIKLTGTSQATAVATGKIIGEKFNNCEDLNE